MIDVTSARRLVVAYNQPHNPADPAEQDVLVQRDHVAAVAGECGYAVDALPCTLDLAAAEARLRHARPDVVFNLVESLGGSDRLMPLVTLLLESLGLPFTGCGTQSLLATSNKLAAKAGLRAAGLPTPDWVAEGEASISDDSREPQARWILKPVWEHASLGMDDDCVVSANSAAELARHLAERRQRTGRVHFAESFVAGREFNLSLLAEGQGPPEVLPPAEIDFSSFPEGKLRIVGYRAKWDPDSFEYRQTPRTFELRRADASLASELADLARRCWDLFNLRGYARVDFRVDDAGRPWILEINANPCLSPDAGFAAALERAGVLPQQAIRRIISAAGVSSS